MKKSLKLKKMKRKIPRLRSGFKKGKINSRVKKVSRKHSRKKPVPFDTIKKKLKFHSKKVKKFLGLHKVRPIHFQIHKILAHVHRPHGEHTLFLGLGFLIFIIFTFFIPLLTQAEVVPVSTEMHFSQNAEPEFILKTKGLIKTSERKSASEELNLGNSKIKVSVSHKSKSIDALSEISTIPERGDQFKISVKNKPQFTPGKYTLKVNLESSLKDQTIEQDFNWGVLAINPDQSIYKPNQESFIGMAVLDDEGEMVSDAKVVLEIIDPESKNTILSTENGTIKISPQINFKGITDLPDYYTTYKTRGVGKYKLKLSAETKNGLREMEDRFYVEEKPDFEVRRDAHTRIYPVVPYPVKLEIKANVLTKGPIREYVPKSFEIMESPEFTVKEKGHFKVLTWNKSFKVGEKKVLEYIYNAPDQSPQFYLTGTLEIGTGENQFEEIRQWQIASDAVGEIEHYIARRVAEQTTTTANWTNVSGTAESGTTASGNGWIDNSNFTNGEKYLIMAWGYHNTSSTTGSSGIEIYKTSMLGSSSFLESQTIEETDQTSASYKTPYFWHTVWTADTNYDLDVRMYNSTPFNTARVEDITLIAMNVEDLIDHGDLEYDYDVAGGTLTTTPTTKASVTWTPENNNDTWWIAGYSKADIIDIDSDQFEARLDIDSTDYSIQSIEGEDAADTPLYGLGWASQLSNSSHTASVQLSESAGNEEWDAAGIFALRLDVFEDFEIDTTSGDQELSAGSGSYNEIAGVTPTPQTAGNWITTGGFIADDNNGRVTARIQESAANITDEDGGWQHNTADTVPFTAGDIASYPTSAMDVDFDARETNNVTPNPDATDTWLVAFSMEQKSVDVSGSYKTYDQSTNGTNGYTVKVAINGTLQTETALTSSGAWTISDIRKPNTDDVITVFVDGVTNSYEANAVTVYDYSGNISGLNLFYSHLAIGSDDNGTITNNDLSQYDNSVSGDEDIFFDVSAGNDLTVDSLAQSTLEELYINASNTHRPDSTSSGNITTHDIEIDGTLTADGNNIFIEGSWDNDSVLTANTSTVYFRATSGTETINSTGATTDDFNNVVVSGFPSTATYNLSSVLDVDGNLDLGDGLSGSGTLAMNGSNNINLAGNLKIYSSGTYTKGTGTFTFDGSGTSTWTDDDSDQDLGIVSINGSSKTVNLATSAVATSVNVAGSQTFGLASSGYTLELTGSGTAGSRPLIVSGTLVEGTNSTVKYLSETATEIEAETYDNLTIATNSVGGNSSYTLGSAVSQTITTDNLTLLDQGVTGYYVTVNATTYDPTLDINDFEIDSLSTFQASDSGTFNVGGNWAVPSGSTFTHNSGEVTFDATTTGKAIESGGSSFNNAVFNSSTGGWTIQTDNFTCANNLTITDVAASGFVVKNITVTVQGTYSIQDAETSNTDWTTNTTTLYLNSGTNYTVGSKTQSAEVYDTLQVGANTDVRIWNSSASTYTVNATGSLYSQDHTAVNGDLYIWGDYHTGTNDYWSYATDFDGTDISGGSERQVDVRVDPSSSVTVDSSDTLASIGTAANRTTVSRQGASNGYGIIVSASGTINFQYTDFDYLDGPDGINVQASSTVTSLANCAFDNLVGTAATDDAFITVASSVIGSAETDFTASQFDNTGAGAEFNVNRTGSDDTGWWYFDTSSGAFDGEANDGKDGVSEADPGMIRWDDSTWNTPPNDPTDLVQKKTDDTVLAVGDWTDETSVKFTATASDTDNPDTLYLEIEVKDINTAFDATGTTTGSGVAYSGTPVTVITTVSGLSDDTEYHWRARIVDEATDTSSWVAYGGNGDGSPADRDFGIDTTAPTGGTVYDGVSGDQDWNDGSLTTLEANWTGFDSTISGLDKYEYAMRREPDDYYWNAGGSTWQAAE
ncbi:beta strand repeat-containing protein, partial [Patescibacteria group bacterium]